MLWIFPCSDRVSRNLSCSLRSPVLFALPRPALCDVVWEGTDLDRKASVQLVHWDANCCVLKRFVVVRVDRSGSKGGGIITWSECVTETLFHAVVSECGTRPAVVSDGEVTGACAVKEG